VHENNDINRLDELAASVAAVPLTRNHQWRGGGVMSWAEAKIVADGPCTLLYTSWVARQCRQH